MNIDFLTTDIGRGHRFYLEGLLREVRRLAPEVKTELFSSPELSHGISRFFWRIARTLYRSGSRPGIVGACYNRFRTSRRPGESSLAHSALGHDIRRWANSRATVSAAVVVDHPLLAELLCGGGDQSNLPPVIYMHGELVAPNDSLARSDLTLVPTNSVRHRFLESGSSDQGVVVTGMCLENSLVPLAESARQARLKRLSQGAVLTGAFFSSGAEPDKHCSQILRAVLSLQETSRRSLVFAKSGGRLERLVSPYSGDEIELISFGSIIEEEALFAERFTQVDYYVAPAHERTNWAMGLALPFFILSPVFGSFAPLNRELASQASAAIALSSERDAPEFGSTLRHALSTGQMAKMNCRSIATINGFTRSAELTISFARKLADSRKIT